MTIQGPQKLEQWPSRGAFFAAVRRFAPATARVEGGDGQVLPGTPEPRAAALPELPLQRRASLRSRYCAGRGRRRTRLTSASSCGCPTPRERIPTLYGQSVVLSTLQLSPSSRAAVTPGQKVATLLEGMLDNGKKKKHEEQVQSADYMQFCDVTTTDMKRDIKEAGEMIEMLQEDIVMVTADEAQLTKVIAGHDEGISV